MRVEQQDIEWRKTMTGNNSNLNPTDSKDAAAEIERLKKELRDKEWTIMKTDAGLKTLYRELEKSKEELEKANTSLEMKVRQRTEELVKLNKALSQELTERKRAEEQLILTNRLASIGELASGIAHELNNPLTSIIGFSQLLLDKNVSEDAKQDINVIYNEALRTAEIVRNLLTFARKHTPVRQLVNVNSIIKKVLELRAYEQKVNNILVNTQFASDLPEIMADYFQLHQVFFNIIINAEFFITEAHHRGTLTITTDRTGGIIRASFTDDGPGISKEDLGHLFDPFFTTKEVGQGTGLGLSICHGIITEHGGRIYAESELGKGATFVVELPISDHW